MLGLNANIYQPKTTQSTKNNQKTIIALHGLYGSNSNLNFLKKFIDNCQIHFIDLPNHGKSFHTKNTSIKFYAQIINKYILQNNLQQAIVIGHSLGGKVAMYLAKINPDLQAIIVLDIAPKKYNPDEHRHIFRALLDINLQQLLDRNQAKLQLEQNIKSPEIVQFLLKSLIQIGDEPNKKWQWAFNLNALANNIDYYDSPIKEKDRIKVAAYFIYGSKSNYLQKKDLAKITKIFTNSSSQAIPEAGHWLHFSHQKIVAQTIVDYITQ